MILQRSPCTTWQCVIYGIHGDLAIKKLFNSLIQLENQGCGPEKIIGIDTAIADQDREAFVQKCDARLHDKIVIQKQLALTTGHTVIHLSVPPEAFGGIIEDMDVRHFTGSATILCEKPYVPQEGGPDHIHALIHKAQHKGLTLRFVDHFLWKASVPPLVQQIRALRAAGSRQTGSLQKMTLIASETLDIPADRIFFHQYGMWQDMASHLIHLLGVILAAAQNDTANVNGQTIGAALHTVDSKDVQCYKAHYTGYHNPHTPKVTPKETFFAIQMACRLEDRTIPVVLCSGKKLARHETLIRIEQGDKTHVIDLHTGIPPNALPEYARLYLAAATGQDDWFPSEDAVRRCIAITHAIAQQLDKVPMACYPVGTSWQSQASVSGTLPP